MGGKAKAVTPQKRGFSRTQSRKEEARSYRPRLVSPGVTKRIVHNDLSFLSCRGAETRITTAPLPVKDDRWDWRHSLVASKDNHKKHTTFREYFDRPRAAEPLGPPKAGFRTPTPFGRGDPIHPLNHQCPEMPRSPSPLSPGCHGRGRLDRGSSDYMFDGTLSLTLCTHPGYERTAAQLKRQKRDMLLNFPLGETRGHAQAWDRRWPGHAQATRVGPDEDPFNQREEETPESLTAPPRCHPQPRACSAVASHNASEMVELNSPKKSGLLYWTSAEKTVKDLVPLHKWSKIQPRDILRDAINGTATLAKPKVRPPRNLLHTPFTAL